LEKITAETERFAKLILCDLFNQLIDCKPPNTPLCDRDEWVEAWLIQGRTLTEKDEIGKNNG
jgi:hypothetical protein